jgi:hypothetical protein
MNALRLIASATIPPPPKPISLPKGTCMAMPKMFTPAAVHSRQTASAAG